MRVLLPGRSRFSIPRVNKAPFFSSSWIRRYQTHSRRLLHPQLVTCWLLTSQRLITPCMYYVYVQCSVVKLAVAGTPIKLRLLHYHVSIYQRALPLGLLRVLPCWRSVYVCLWKVILANVIISCCVILSFQCDMKWGLKTSVAAMSGVSLVQYSPSDNSSSDSEVGDKGGGGGDRRPSAKRTKRLSQFDYAVDVK